MKLYITTARELYKFYRWKGESHFYSLQRIYHFYAWMNGASSEELSAYVEALRKAQEQEKEDRT